MSEETKTRTPWSIRQKLLVAFLVLIGGGTLVICSALFWELHMANVAMRSFGDALATKSYERAYDLTCPELKQTVSYTEFVKVHEGLRARMGDFKNLDVSQANVKEESDGWHGTIEARMIFERGRLPFIFALKKQGGLWLVFNYREQ